MAIRRNLSTQEDFYPVNPELPDLSSQQPPPWIQNDYWAPDRADVLADPSRWGPGPNEPQPGQPPAPPTELPVPPGVAPMQNDYKPKLPASPGVQRNDYTPLAGWEQSKLNDPTKHNTKYDFGRAAQDYGQPIQRGNLQGLVDYYNQSYGGHAKTAGDDSIDFGESYGPVDILNGNGDSLQWYVPGQGQAAAGGGAAGGLDLSGLTSSDALNKILGQIGGGGNHTAQAIEAARMPYEIARRSQLNNAQAVLADRGLLSEPGHAQGPEVTAVQRIEEGLAPAYTGAISDRLLQEDQTNVQRQQVLGDIALRSLDQNRLWNQFLAQYGLDREKVAYDMQHGNTDQYLQLLQIWLASARTSDEGYV